MIFVAINWIGCILLLIGYVILTLRNPNLPWRKIATVMSLIGQVLVGIWALSILATPVIVMELVFIGVSIFQFWRMCRKNNS